MALPGSGVVNQGLQRCGRNLAIVGGGAGVGSSQTVTRYLMTMSVDDNATNFAAADTALNTSRGTVTNEYDQLLDALATISSQTISFTTTIGTANGNFVHKGLAWHDDTATNVTSSSATLIAGIAGQSITKSSSFSIAYTGQITFSDNS